MSLPWCFFSQAVELSDVPMTVLNRASLELSLTSNLEVARTASADTLLALLRSKCLPVLLYVTHARPLLVRDQRSLRFSVTRVFMTIFRTGLSPL